MLNLLFINLFARISYYLIFGSNIAYNFINLQYCIGSRTLCLSIIDIACEKINLSTYA